VGLVVYLEDGNGEVVRTLPDPAGGSFDAAGDFDRLINWPPERLSVWPKIDPDAAITLGPPDIGELITDIDRLARHAKPGPEARGLARLRVMAETARDRQMVLRFLGD
jgi:hypothetical protein